MVKLHRKVGTNIYREFIHMLLVYEDFVHYLKKGKHTKNVQTCQKCVNLIMLENGQTCAKAFNNAFVLLFVTIS